MTKPGQHVGTARWSAARGARCPGGGHPRAEGRDGPGASWGCRRRKQRSPTCRLRKRASVPGRSRRSQGWRTAGVAAAHNGRVHRRAAGAAPRPMAAQTRRQPQLASCSPSAACGPCRVDPWVPACSGASGGRSPWTGHESPDRGGDGTPPRSCGCSAERSPSPASPGSAPGPPPSPREPGPASRRSARRGCRRRRAVPPAVSPRSGPGQSASSWSSSPSPSVSTAPRSASASPPPRHRRRRRRRPHPARQRHLRAGWSAGDQPRLCAHGPRRRGHGERAGSAAPGRRRRAGRQPLSCGTDPWHHPDQVGLQLDRPRYHALQAQFDRRGPAGRPDDAVHRRPAGVPWTSAMVRPATERWLLLNAAGPVLSAALANSPVCDGVAAGAVMHPLPGLAGHRPLAHRVRRGARLCRCRRLPRAGPRRQRSSPSPPRPSRRRRGPPCRHWLAADSERPDEDDPHPPPLDAVPAGAASRLPRGPLPRCAPPWS